MSCGHFPMSLATYFTSLLQLTEWSQEDHLPPRQMRGKLRGNSWLLTFKVLGLRRLGVRNIFKMLADVKQWPTFPRVRREVREVEDAKSQQILAPAKVSFVPCSVDRASSWGEMRGVTLQSVWDLLLGGTCALLHGSWWDARNNKAVESTVITEIWKSLTTFLCANVDKRMALIWLRRIWVRIILEDGTKNCFSMNHWCVNWRNDRHVTILAVRRPCPRHWQIPPPSHNPTAIP